MSAWVFQGLHESAEVYSVLAKIYKSLLCSFEVYVGLPRCLRLNWGLLRSAQDL